MGEKKSYRLGIDIGGTFTDLTLIEEQTQKIVGIKTPTVPLAPEQGVKNGLKVLKETYGLNPEEIRYFVHGMTIGLNTLLQRKGAKIALFVTEGFRDILTMQRMRLPVPYDFHSRLPKPLVPRNLVYGIKERTLFQGEEETSVDYASVDQAIADAKKQGVEGIAICFLHSYINGTHEQQVESYIKEKAPELKVCASSEIWPEMREYERAVIAVVNLYIQKNVETYFENLKQILKEEGVRVKPFITQSNGGIMNLDTAAKMPIRTLFSGPAAGVIGAVNVAAKAGETELLTFDMGGTSTDISVVQNGTPTMGQKSELADFPIVMPSIDIESIGAGGGSIGWLDAGGMLKVGPESAGSDPGPACYGKSFLPTLTDSFLLCGYLNPERFAAGSMGLDEERSEKALKPLAEKLQLSVRELADRLIQISIANMYAQLSNVMEQKGFDPRELTVLAYGGGGPVTANFIAEEIHAKKVLVPFRPGTLCAAGALSASFVYDEVRPVQNKLSALSAEEITKALEELTVQAKEWLDAQESGLDMEHPLLEFLADARYQGQSYEIQIPLDPEALLKEGLKKLASDFHAQHQKLYGHFEESAEIELVNIRARIEGQAPEFPASESSENEKGQIKTKRPVYINGTEYQADIYDRATLKAGTTISGPAVVEQDDTTVLILPDWKGTIDPFYNLHIVRKEEEA